jgi:hypothetical protein
MLTQRIGWILPLTFALAAHSTALRTAELSSHLVLHQRNAQIISKLRREAFNGLSVVGLTPRPESFQLRDARGRMYHCTLLNQAAQNQPQMLSTQKPDSPRSENILDETILAGLSPQLVVTRRATSSQIGMSAETLNETTSMDQATMKTAPDQSNFLSPLNGICLYARSGWWQYEVCPGRHVRQFHVEDNNIEAQFSLGEFVGEVQHDNLQQSPPHMLPHSLRLPIIIETYAGGSICDIVRLPRSTEVVYTCSVASIIRSATAEQRSLPTLNESTRITQVEEVASCQYHIVVETSLLCKHPEWQKRLEAEQRHVVSLHIAEL